MLRTTRLFIVLTLCTVLFCVSCFGSLAHDHSGCVGERCRKVPDTTTSILWGRPAVSGSGFIASQRFRAANLGVCLQLGDRFGDQRCRGIRRFATRCAGTCRPCIAADNAAIHSRRRRSQKARGGFVIGLYGSERSGPFFYAINIKLTAP